MTNFRTSTPKMSANSKRRQRNLKPRARDDLDASTGQSVDLFDEMTRQRQSRTPRRCWRRLTDQDVCYRALRRIVAKPSSNTAGIDHVKPYDLSPRACGAAARLMSKKLRDRTYRPAKLLPKQIPKGDPAEGKTRTIEIATPPDRVADLLVSYALREAIAHPFPGMSQHTRDAIVSDIGLFNDGPQTFDEATEVLRHDRLTLDVYAVRGQGTREFLADLGVAMDSGRHNVGNHDIRDAYPSMPIEPCLDAFEQLKVYDHPWFRGDPEAARHVVRALLTNGGRRTKRLPQGLTLSEIALDARLHFDHDLPVRELLHGENAEGGTP